MENAPYPLDPSLAATSAIAIHGNCVCVKAASSHHTIVQDRPLTSLFNTTDSRKEEEVLVPRGEWEAVHSSEMLVNMYAPEPWSVN